MKKRFVAIIAALFIFVYAMPQEVFAGVVSLFANNDAFCVHLPKTASALNLLDISKKITVKHFDLAKKFFTSCFADGDFGKTREISETPFAAINNFKSENFINFPSNLKIFSNFLYFYRASTAPLTRAKRDIFVNWILLRLKTVFMTIAPCDDAIIIKLYNKFINYARLAF
jgi:hypothetical protein